MKKLFLAVALVAGCQTSSTPAPKVTPAVAAPATPAPGEPPMLPVGTNTVCPVTGEKFTVKEKTPQVAYNGKRYAFCCGDCAPDFNKNPAKYAK